MNPMKPNQPCHPPMLATPEPPDLAADSGAVDDRSNSTSRLTFIELNEAEMDALIQRVEAAIADDLALSKSDLQLILSALGSLLHLHHEIGDRRVTLHQLRKLLGLVSASEKLKVLMQQGMDADAQTDVAPDADGETATGERPAKNKSTQHADTAADKPARQPPRERKTPPTIHHHAFPAGVKGSVCPDCGRGKLYKAPPATFLRIQGHTPFSAHRHVMERVRCNACQGYQTATPSAAVLADGEVGQQYGYSARALMCLNKFYMGLPYARQESLQNLLGEPISASTVFDQCEHVANATKPVFDALCRLTGNAELILLDDTRHTILDRQGGIQKPDRRTGVLKERTGVYSSGVLATLFEGQQTALFETNIGHAGEWLDRLLAYRNPDTPPVKLMSDALSSNRPTHADQAIIGLCNSHARREFADLIVSFRHEVLEQLGEYARIWLNEKQVKADKLDPVARRDYHQQHSLPVMQTIKDWGQTQLDTEAVEENSRLGEAIRYFIKHYHGLTRFCFELNMPLDNNAMEALLKIVIRNRKNAMFFKTQIGATLGDILTSIIATCHLNDVNPYEYLMLLQRHASAVKADPLNWLPWNYPADLTGVFDSA